jgi:hypothetical protein
MANKPAIFFVHRINKNETQDSICLVCFRTVASKRSEAELGDLERQHECDILDVFHPVSDIDLGIKVLSSDVPYLMLLEALRRIREPRL